MPQPNSSSDESGASKTTKRCTYCMPEEGVELAPPRELLTSDEIVRLGRVFTSLGARKIRLTGGEPTVRKDFIDVFSDLAALETAPTMCLTTNGLTLRRHLPALEKARLSVLNISLDTLDEDKFEVMTRRRGFKHVLRSIDAALETSIESVKLNCVVMRNINDEEVQDFVEFTRHRPVTVRFIEYMPFDGNRWSDTRMVPYGELVSNIERVYPTLRRVGDSPNDTTKHYQVDGFAGRIGFISSMTEHFCGSCNRVRLTADGNLKVCLFGNAEVSLRDAMRAGASDADLTNLIGGGVIEKKARHAGMFEIARSKNRPMIKIGG